MRTYYIVERGGIYKVYRKGIRSMLGIYNEWNYVGGSSETSLIRCENRLKESVAPRVVKEVKL